MARGPMILRFTVPIKIVNIYRFLELNLLCLYAGLLYLSISYIILHYLTLSYITLHYLTLSYYSPLWFFYVFLARIIAGPNPAMLAYGSTGEILVKSSTTTSILFPKLRWRAPWSRRWNGSGHLKIKGTWWVVGSGHLTRNRGRVHHAIEIWLSRCFKPQSNGNHMMNTWDLQHVTNHCLKMDDKEKLGVSSIHFLDGKTHCHPGVPIIHSSISAEISSYLGQLTSVDHAHMIHVWYIYLQNWVIFRANVGVHIPAPWFAYGMGQFVLGALMEHWDQDHLPDQLQEVGPPDGRWLFRAEEGKTWGPDPWGNRSMGIGFGGFGHDFVGQQTWWRSCDSTIKKKGFNWFWCVSNKNPQLNGTSVIICVEKWW